MSDYTGQIVQATAGRDKGDVFCVVGMDQRRSDCCWPTGSDERSPAQRQRSWAMYGS